MKSTLDNEGLTFLELRGDAPQRRLYAQDQCGKQFHQICLFVEDSRGWMDHAGGKFLYEKSGNSIQELEASCRESKRYC